MTNFVDPQYVQISKQKAADILGRSTAELDKLRKSDPRCPKGFKAKPDQFSRVMFRLSDIYEYSEVLIKDAESVTERAMAVKGMNPSVQQ